MKQNQPKSLRSRGVSLACLTLLCSTVLTFAQSPGSQFFHAELAASGLEEVAQSPEQIHAQSLTWLLTERPSPITRQGSLAVGSIKAAEQNHKPARTNIILPKDGKYYLWARYIVHPIRAKSFKISLQGQENLFASKPYGGSPDEEIGMPLSDPNLNWEAMQDWKDEREEIYGPRALEPQHVIWTRRELELKAGPSEVILAVTPRNELSKGVVSHAPEVDSIVITNDPDYQP